jgi:aldose 1-epimerase
MTGNLGYKKIDQDDFGRHPGGEKITRFTLTNRSGAQACVITYGAITTAIRMPDKTGTFGDVALGFETISPYLENSAYIGAAIGPVAGRISGAQFCAGGQTYELDKNEGDNCLHSGRQGYHCALWTPQITGSGLRLWLETPAGRAGFPGRVTCAVDISLSDENALTYRYRAISDSPTPLSLTHHDYFNLSSGGARRADDHTIQIMSDKYAALDPDNLPIGALADVCGSPYDLRKPVSLCRQAYDQHFIVAGSGLRHMARAQAQSSGRRLDVFSNADGLQFYNGRFLPKTTGLGGRRYGPFSGFALEPQQRPNAVNLPQFPSIIRQANTPYDHSIIYKFGLID